MTDDSIEVDEHKYELSDDFSWDFPEEGRD